MKKLAALAVLLTFSVVTTAQNGKPLVFVLSLFDPSDKIIAPMDSSMKNARPVAVIISKPACNAC